MTRSFAALSGVKQDQHLNDPTCLVVLRRTDISHLKTEYCSNMLSPDSNLNLNYNVCYNSLNTTLIRFFYSFELICILLQLNQAMNFCAKHKMEICKDQPQPPFKFNFVEFIIIVCVWNRIFDSIFFVTIAPLTEFKK